MKSLLLFLVKHCLAQKEYIFDYIIEYKTKSLEDTLGKSWINYLLTNSKDVTYIAELFEKTALTFG